MTDPTDEKPADEAQEEEKVTLQNSEEKARELFFAAHPNLTGRGLKFTNAGPTWTVWRELQLVGVINKTTGGITLVGETPSKPANDD